MHASISYSPEKKEGSYKPGPGTYNGDSIKVKRKEPSYGLGSATRLDLESSKRALFQVSPNKYNPNLS
jgi:hypothetical protein